MNEQHEYGDALAERERVERKKAELIDATKDPAFCAKVSRRARQLNGKEIDAERCAQEAIRRFISMVKSKTRLVELEEIERRGSLSSVYMMLNNMKTSRCRKM